jgi:hypothetical protein
MELTGSDVGSIAAALIAGLAFLHSIRVQYKQKELIRELSILQRELAVLELKNAKEREMNKERAEFTARFVAHRNSSKKLVITNVGAAQARDVKIDFDKGANFVLLSEIDDLFPCILDSSESVKLLATSALGNTAVRESFTLTWMDNAGGGQKEFKVQYA